ncbi:glycosyltransferase family 4 protein [Zobellia amurskyensis]|uniref:Glycosyltransferase family 4 protein n=1 Tax=Zobellia amurskyensis TaxID=248905 RepID=A0A7X3D2A6_9FLAO|nr:glycosyltransferase [Zobellia amurskyensis]MUH36916.1 glycosyltransferase family 4 protein [Zobellia amurskyensis]
MKDKKKIAFVIHSLTDGGAERVVSALANYFSSKYDVIIITMVEINVFYRINPSVNILSARNAAPSNNIIGAILNNWKTVKKIAEIINQEKVDILISFTTSVNVLTILASIYKKKPCLISERNNAKIVPPNLFWKKLRDVFYKYSNFLIVQTKGNKEFYSSIISKSKIKIIQNPISESLISSRKKLSKTNKPINILTVGRLTQNKAQHIILNSLVKIKRKDWILTIVGDGPTMNDLKKLSIDLGINDKIIFMGQVENVSDFYLNADIFVFSSRSEGFPNALIEAYSFGIPCISTDCDFGPSDIITHGKDGFLISVNDEKELAKRLTQLIDDRDLRLNISKNAIENTARFDMPFIASKWEKLVLEAINLKSVNHK